MPRAEAEVDFCLFSRSVWPKSCEVDATTEEEVGQELFSWSVGEYGWKEGGRRKWLAQESTAEKSGV